MEKLVFIFIIINSLIFTFAVPPFQKPDEIAHFYRAVGLSTGQLFCKKNNKGEKVVSIPKSLYSLPELFQAREIRFVDDKKLTINHANIEKYLSNIDNNNVETTEGCLQYVTGYIPNVIGLLSRFITNNPLIIFYMGRVSGLLFFLLCFYYSLKIIPRPFHIILYIFSIIPMIIHQVTSYSYDVLLFSTTLIVFAFLVRIYVQKTVTFQEFIKYQVGIVLFVAGKPIALPFILLHLFIPYTKIPKKRSILILLSLIFFIISFILSLFYLL